MRARSVQKGRWILVVAIALVLGQCGNAPPPPLPVPDSVPSVDPANVESVVFLLGDAGLARDESSPILARLQQDVEWWSQRVENDSSVVVLVLGDNVYPVGLRPLDDPAFASDTAVLMSQVRAVGGPASRARGARAFFVAGNHDWGLRIHRTEFARIRAQDAFLDAVRNTTGVQAALVPEAGTGGPHVLDLGRHLRILLLDSAWWLLGGNVPEKAEVLAGIEEALSNPGGREIMVAAHHPFTSAGPHGGQFSLWTAAGARYLLYRSGAILQDITSDPYQALENGLRGIFARHGPPLAFLGGHDHSLQVIAGVEPTDPLFSLIAGSGSKLSELGRSRAMRFGAMAPGYMRILIGEGGEMTLFVEAAPPEYLLCEGGEDERTACMVEGVAAVRTTYVEQLR